VEEAHAEQRRTEIDLPGALEEELAPEEDDAKPLRPAS
jgi:hypothetical protein